MNGPLKVAERVQRLFVQVRDHFPTIFKSTEVIELTPSVVSYIVSQLQMYSLLESDVDVKGRAYEEVVGANLRGDRGEFFTPRNICQMAVEMLDPSDSDLIIDPACGTGGFLIVAMNHVTRKIIDVESAKWSANRAATSIRARVDHFNKTNIVGLDLNPNLVKASKMNMVMNNDGSGGLFQTNSLANPASWADDLRERSLIDSVDCLFTNPPFGSKIPIEEPSILERYDLGHQWTYDATSDAWVMHAGLQKSQPPEILFIERCVNLLKPGTGRAAMVRTGRDSRLARDGLRAAVATRTDAITSEHRSSSRHLPTEHERADERDRDSAENKGRDRVGSGEWCDGGLRDLHGRCRPHRPRQAWKRYVRAGRTRKRDHRRSR